MALDSDAALFWASELTEHNVCRNALEMKQLVALLLTNEMRNYGDTKHADPPDRWLFAERVPSEVLQRLGHRLRGHYVAPTYVAPTAKKRARQISRSILSLGRCVFSFACAFNLYRSPIRDTGDAAPKKSAYTLLYCAAA